MGKIETIFDHDPTDAEILLTMGKLWEKVEYLKVITDQQSAYVDLWRLYSIRNNEKTAEKYFNLIEDKILRRELKDVEWGYFPLRLK